MKLLLSDRKNGNDSAPTATLTSTYNNPGEAHEGLIVVTGSAHLEPKYPDALGGQFPPEYVGMQIFLNGTRLGYTRTFVYFFRHPSGDGIVAHTVLPVFVGAGLDSQTLIKKGENTITIEPFTSRTRFKQQDEFEVQWYFV